MSEWTRPAQPVRCVVELDKPLSTRRERWTLVQGDANANAIVAEVYQTSGKPFDLTGSTVMLTFVRPDNKAVPSIRAEISGNVAIATLTDDCYSVTGMYVATMQLRKNGAERTILWLIGDVKGKNIDGVVDNENVIPSLEDLMATAAEAQVAVSAANAAAEKANAAASRANAGAERAEQLQLDASGLAGDSNRLGGKPAEAYAAVSLIDNGDWRVPKNIVNQRGIKSLTTTDSYFSRFFDRWSARTNGYEATIGTKGVRFNFTAATDARAGMRQVALASDFAGKSITLAAKFRQNAGIANLVIGLTDSSRSWGDVLADGRNETTFTGTGIKTVTETIPENPGRQLISFFAGNFTGAVGITEIEWVAVYEGSYTPETLPIYVSKGFPAELLACKQYYVQFKQAYIPASIHNTSNRRYIISFLLDVPLANTGTTPTASIITAPSTLRANGTSYNLADLVVESVTVFDSSCYIVIQTSTEIPNAHAAFVGTSEYAISKEL